MTTVARTRSRLLSFWLIFHTLLFGVVAVALIITLVNAAQNPVDDLSQTQQWAALLMIVLSLANVGAAIALWNWRRWAILFSSSPPSRW